MKTLFIKITFFSLLVLLQSCAGLNNSGSSGGGTYRDPYYGGSYKGGSRDYDRYDRRERERLEWERERLKEERRDLERDRDRQERRERRHRSRGEVVAPVPAKPEKCPSGYYPNDRKCTDSERRKGCKDLRISSGQLCVKGR